MILCVDDYGISRGVTDAVASMAEISTPGAISASWYPAVRSFAEPCLKTPVGLHFRLTGGSPLPGGLPSRRPGELALSLSSIRRADVISELGSQWDAFVSLFGREPSHFDSHHHVHQWPVISSAVLSFLSGRRREGWGGYARSSVFKKPGVATLPLHIPGTVFRSRASSCGIPHGPAVFVQPRMEGISSSSVVAETVKAVSFALTCDSLVCVHPSSADDVPEAEDRMSSPRVWQYGAVMTHLRLSGARLSATVAG